MKVKITRGIRNNNPFNIRRSKQDWKGKRKVFQSLLDGSFGDGYDTDFEVFVSMDYGIRAGLVLLSTYISRYHLTSVEDIISRFAPASENDTFRYIRFIRSFLLSENCTDAGGIKVGSKEFLNLARGIMIFESNYRVSFAEISSIYNNMFNLK